MNSDEFLAQREKLEKQVYIKGDAIFINVRYEYRIELSRCNTPEKILKWVYHLTEKTWMNTDILGRFIEVAGRQIGWDPH